MNLEQLYNSNKAFKSKVDECCTMLGIAKEQAFEMMIVQVVARQYAERGEEE